MATLWLPFLYSNFFTFIEKIFIEKKFNKKEINQVKDINEIDIEKLYFICTSGYENKERKYNCIDIEKLYDQKLKG